MSIKYPTFSTKSPGTRESQKNCEHILAQLFPLERKTTETLSCVSLMMVSGVLNTIVSVIDFHLNGRSELSAMS